MAAEPVHHPAPELTVIDNKYCISPLRRPPDCVVDFDLFRNVKLVLSIGVARFGRADVEAVLLTLCLGDLRATVREGERDHTDVLNLNGQCVEWSAPIEVVRPLVWLLSLEDGQDGKTPEA